MENQEQINSSAPLLEASYVDGVVKHPFPLNYLLRKWYLGSDFYHAVKVGIVQYVCVPLVFHLIFDCSEVRIFSFLLAFFLSFSSTLIKFSLR